MKPRKTIFSWAPGWRWYAKIDAQKAGELLESLRDRNGEAKPSDIVAAGKPARSPIHTAFEWDDSKAGHLYRCEQARDLAGALFCTVKTAKGEQQVRAFASIRTNGDREYVALGRVLTDADMRQQLYADALESMNQWRVRFGTISEVLGEVDRAIRKLSRGVGKPAAVDSRGTKGQPISPSTPA